MDCFALKTRYYIILDDPSAGMYSCEVTTTSFRSMVASGEMRVIGGLRVALKKCDFLGICPNMGRGLNFQKSCLVILRC